LAQINSVLTLTDTDKKLLFGEESSSVDLEGEGQGEFEDDFENAKGDFYSALHKVEQMYKLQEQLPPTLLGKDTKDLAKSLKEQIEFVEENAFVKLAKHLKRRIRYFDTPLESQPDFLRFLKVTLGMLHTKQPNVHAYLVGELIKSRSKFIRVSFKEKVALLHSKSTVKRVSQLMAWLHETAVNEKQILEGAVEQGAFKSVFNKDLQKNIC